MCQKTEQGGRGQIKRRARGWCRSQRADPAARDGPDPAAGSGSCQTEKPDRGAAGLSGEAGVGPGVRWRDHCSNKDPLEDGGAGPGRDRTVRRGQGGAWRPVEGPLQQRRLYLTVWELLFTPQKLLSTPTILLLSITLHTHQEKNPPPSFPFVARLPLLPEVLRLLSIALHLPPSPEVPRLLFVALRLSVGSNRETEGDGEEAGNFQRGREADGERRRRRLTDTKGRVAAVCRCRRRRRE